MFLIAPTSCIDIAVSIVLGLVMFGVGLSIKPSEVFDLFKHPKALGTALVTQMVFIPAIAIGLCWLWPLPAPIKVGLIVLAACPGGATSGFLTYLWRGRVALSLSLTSINSMLTLFSIPIVINFGLKLFLGKESDILLPFWPTVQQIFSITIIPATLGILIRHFQTDIADKIEKPAKYVMLALLFLVFAIKVFAGESHGGSGLTQQDLLLITPYALIQNIACLLVGYGVLWRAGLNHPTRLTGAMESGVQNTTLAFLIAGTLLHNQEMVKPALIYSMFSFWTACLFAYFSNRYMRPEEPAYEVED